MSLQFNVLSLSEEEAGAVREYNVDSQLLVGNEPIHGSVQGNVDMLRTIDGILVTAGLTGTQAEQCSLCLKEIKVLLQFKVEEEFIATADAVSGAALPPPEDPEVFRISPTHILDLDEAVRQSWLSAMPMQALCKPDCSGLCPECGQDRNQGACSCTPAPDERWGALRELSRQMKGT